jgi:hypothetical protein
MFISWEQRAMFLDNMDAMMWQRAPDDCERASNAWEHTFCSKLDPVKDTFKSFRE